MDLNYFRSHIKEELKKEGLTLSSLSQKADLSEDTLRSLIYGKSQDVKLSTITKIAEVLDCSIDYLIGRYDWFYDEPPIKKIQTLSPRSIQTIQKLITLELNSTQLPSQKHSNIIPILIPTGKVKDGNYYDNTTFQEHDISDYPNHLQQIINLGIMINSDYYEPTYYKNDILLLSTEKKPEFGDIAVYQSVDGRIYIRQFTPSGLEPIDQFGQSIPIRRQNLYTAIGVVVKVTKEFDIEQYR